MTTNFTSSYFYLKPFDYLTGNERPLVLASSTLFMSSSIVPYLIQDRQNLSVLTRVSLGLDILCSFSNTLQFTNSISFIFLPEKRVLKFLNHLSRETRYGKNSLRHFETDLESKEVMEALQEFVSLETLVFAMYIGNNQKPSGGALRRQQTNQQTVLLNESGTTTEEEAVSRFPPSLRELTFHTSDEKSYSDAFVEAIAKKFGQRLNALRLCGRRNFELLTNKGIEKLADHCPKLESLTLEGCNPGLTNEGLQLIADKFPNLRNLDLNDCLFIADLAPAFADPNSIGNVLESFVFQTSPFGGGGRSRRAGGNNVPSPPSSEDFLKTLPSIFPFMKRLKVLNFAGSVMSDEAVDSICNNLSSLEELNIRCGGSLTFHGCILRIVTLEEEEGKRVVFRNSLRRLILPGVFPFAKETDGPRSIDDQVLSKIGGFERFKSLFPNIKVVEIGHKKLH